MARTRPPGRPTRTHLPELTSPCLARLVQEMSESRNGKTLAEIAKSSHYSISALSGATSGCHVPTAALIEAYAKACGVDPAPWLALRKQAKEEEKRGASPARREKEPAAALLPATRSSASTELVLHSHGRLPKKRANRRDEDAPPPEPPPAGLDEHMAALIRQATETAGRTSAPIHVDPVTGALSLCTVPKDLMDLLRTLWRNSEVSLREMERRVRCYSIAISKSSLHTLLNGSQLPPVDVLAAILRACDISQDQIDVWLYHRARLEIAGVRHAVRHPSGVEPTLHSVAVRSLNRFSYDSRWTQILLAVCSLLAALIPLLMRI